jgi:hypothetical protein
MAIADTASSEFHHSMAAPAQKPRTGRSDSASVGPLRSAQSRSDANGAVLTRWEMPHAHGMGIDTSGNIYVGCTKELRVDKYVRVH